MRVNAETFRRSLRTFAAVVATACLVVVTYVGINFARGNFHEVVPGELYRSAQPDAQFLAWAKRTYGIKSVLNLRGPSMKADWYKTEIAASEALGMVHVDFRMSARRQLTDPEAKRLEGIMATLPKPLLIHCLSGADRTGLAAAIYLHFVDGLPSQSAGHQLSIVYGHLGLPDTMAYPMDESWDALVH